MGISRGGGIYNAADLTLTNSTVANNTVRGPYTGQFANLMNGNGGSGNNGGHGYEGGNAGNGGNAGIAPEGGVIVDGGGLFNQGAASVVNVTFNANHFCDYCQDSGLATGLLPGQPGTPGTGDFDGTSGRAGEGSNSLVWGGDSISTVSPPDGAATLTLSNVAAAPVNDYGITGICRMAIAPADGGGNLISDTSCGVAGGGTDPGLSPVGLADNGGPTQTIAVLPDSAAKDAGNDSVCDAAPVSHFDQRGVGRPQGPHCDTGAFELAGGPQINPFVVTSTLFMALGSCTQTLCTLPDAVAAANALGTGATITSIVTGTINVTGPLAITNDIAIIGPDAEELTISGPQLFTVSQGESLALRQLSFMGAPVANTDQHMITSTGSLTLDDVMMMNNEAIGGPSMLFNNGGSLTVANSTLSNNSAQTIENQGGLLTIRGSTFTANIGPNPVIAQEGFATIANSTFAGNGTVLDSVSGSTTLLNDTFSGNQGSDGADIQLSSTGAVTAANTIFDSSFSGSCSGNIIDNGHNMETGDTCGLGSDSRSNTSPQLLGLAKNGGSTPTMDLATTSPARDAGDDVTCQAAPVDGVDQRGVYRPQGGHCDIGAVEANAPLAVDHESPDAPSSGNDDRPAAEPHTRGLAVTGASIPVPLLAGLTVILLIGGIAMTRFARRHRRS
ncbi:right-handed parallel beta-helix repeat-containing protein [Glaciibacter flavus]|uniref:Right-handed parallel beta-helix repeat-containing protein n=2 Tax=Orlajensenia flava TaxID=2565934 RepID=A0A4S4FVT1_9MICO|nr:right-handed parallel beta-helix repeat-containing protein [Glaciibacter flavus]